jgi:hypothetical protein
MVMLGPPEKIDTISSDLASKKQSQKAFGRAVFSLTKSLTDPFTLSLRLSNLDASNLNQYDSQHGLTYLFKSR